MRICISVCLIFLAVYSVSCTSPPTRRPIPDRPLIAGQILGVPNDEVVTIRVRALAGHEVLWMTQLGSGSWKVVITEAGGVDYIVTAEAKNYVSQPVSYTVHISGDTAYVMRNGQVTGEEAIHLDFHFVPKESP